MLGKLNLLKASWSFTSLAAKVGVIAVATTIGLANVVGSAGATLDAVATNTTAQTINSGTLSLVLGNGSFGASTSAGFDTYASKMRPLDSFSRFVNYVTGADMGIASPKLQITATGDAIMTTGANSLRVWVQSCSVAWDASGVCTSGTRTDLFGASGSPVAISTLATAQSISSGVNLTANATNYLKYTLSLPDKSETTTNGVAPAVGSIQGKSAALTWTFSALQSATTADSNA